MNQSFSVRNATTADLDKIWTIISFAIECRKNEGSNQWQDGYPNTTTITQDIDLKQAFVVEQNGEILAYFALIFDTEPAYEALVKGSWQSNEKYAVVHRVAVGKSTKGKGLGKWILQQIENLCFEKNYFYIRIDTNFDNRQMLRILENLNYKYCGKVYFRNSERLAFDKILNPTASD